MLPFIKLDYLSLVGPGKGLEGDGARVDLKEPLGTWGTQRFYSLYGVFVDTRTTLRSYFINFERWLLLYSCVLLKLSSDHY